jgi:CRISPR/Cas system CMR-associated protein Cmr5 small subunit
MSIGTHNREVALKAFEYFQRDIAGKDPKPYLNAAQKALLLLGSQGLRRTILYITAQMDKEDKKSEASGNDAPFTNQNAYKYLYTHLAEFSGRTRDRFQYEVLCQYSKETIAQQEPQIALFLRYVKHLAESYYKKEVGMAQDREGT